MWQTVPFREVLWSAVLNLHTWGIWLLQYNFWSKCGLFLYHSFKFCENLDLELKLLTLRFTLYGLQNSRLMKTIWSLGTDLSSWKAITRHGVIFILWDDFFLVRSVKGVASVAKCGINFQYYTTILRKDLTCSLAASNRCILIVCILGISGFITPQPYCISYKYIYYIYNSFLLSYWTPGN